VLQHPESLGLPVREFEAWHRLYSLLTIEPGSAQVSQSPTLATLIRPVIDMFELLELPETDTSTLNLTGAAGGFITGYTVPNDSRVILTNAWMEASTGSCAIAVSLGGILVPLTLRQTAEKLFSGAILVDRTQVIGGIRDADAGDTAIDLTLAFKRIVCYR